MSALIRKPNTYVIEKCGMSGWYLYTVELCSFGTQIKWTKNLNNALMFSSQDRLAVFKNKMLGDMLVCYHHFAR